MKSSVTVRRASGLGILAAALVGVVALALVQIADAQEDPIYYVDGARPTRDPNQTYQGTEGCVPYSPERPDEWICGELPEGWRIAPPPGDASAYSDVCAKALQVFSERQDIVGWPDIDPSSCYVAPADSYPGEDPKSPEYYVSFKPAPSLQSADPVTIPLDTD